LQTFLIGPGTEEMAPERTLLGGFPNGSDWPKPSSISSFARTPIVPLSCSPFQGAGANILLLAIERFKSTAVRQGKRHDHENDG
jgi:hypothetical protein